MIVWNVLASNFSALIQKCLLTPVVVSAPRAHIRNQNAQPQPRVEPMDTYQTASPLSPPGATLTQTLDKFDVNPTEPDGHCVMSAFLHSFQRQIGGDSWTLNKESVISDIWQHAENNFEQYASIVVSEETGSSEKKDFLQDLYEYLFKKKFNKTTYYLVDIVPFILANIYCIDLIIADVSLKMLHKAPSRDSMPSGEIFIKKRGAHYEGLTPKPRVNHANNKPY